MSLDTDIFANAGVDTADTDEQARKAVKAFRALQPTLSAYARILTKRPGISVQMAVGDNGSTDGKKIYYRPPLALGSPVPHERRLCDKRDENMQSLCPACGIRERVLRTIYHEIAHICFDSFAETTDGDRARLIDEAIKQVHSKYAEQVKKRIQLAPEHQKRSYVGLAALVNRFLPLIVNGLEDARINRELFKARRGVKAMFDADTWRIFAEGVEQRDPMTGKTITQRWDTYPLNQQIIVGIFVKASGYDYSSWFAPQVVEALNDPELTDIVRRIDTVRSVNAVYNLSFPVLARLRELGFCATPEDPDENAPEEEDEDATEPGEPEPSPEGEDEGDEQPQPSDSEGSGEGESDDTSEQSDGQPDPDAGSESGSGQESESGEVDESQAGEADSADPEGDSGSEPSGDGDAGGSSSDDEGPADETEPQDGATGEPSADGDSQDESDEGGSEPAAGDSEGEGEVGEGDTAPASSAPKDGDGDQSSSESGGPSASSDDGSDESEGDDSDLPEQSDTSPSSGDGESWSDDAPSDADATGSGSGDSEGTLESGEDHPDDLAGESDPATPQAGEGGDLEELPESEERDDPDDSSESDEPIDTGADDGQGGTQVIEKSEYDDLPMGDPEDAKTALLQWMQHEEKPKTVEETRAEQAVDRAIIQGIYFETPSRNVYGVREHRWGQPVYVGNENMSVSWDHGAYLSMGFSKRSLGIEGDFNTPEAILGPALMRMRVAFADNQRGEELRHRKTGRVDGRVLGKRAPMKDERLFKKKILPGKKSYFVLIGVDVSGSTVGRNLQLEKKAVFAQAELCSRMGIDFAIYAHSGNYHDPTGGRGAGLDLDMYVVKERHEPWDKNLHERLEALGPDSCNLDGHSLEFYRKRLDEQQATDKIILYYTDGKMPAENHDEELDILQREIKVCRQRGYTLLGVGIRTDSPLQHGLDTVQVDTEADVVKVVRHLEKRLVAATR